MELRIESLAPGGEGVARTADGRVVFVPGAVPGDRVEVAVGGRSGGATRGRILRVVEPAPGRVEPICPVAAACGGCDWMHLAVAEQEKQHAAIVTALLERAVGRELPEARTHAAPRALAYRSRARLHARSERGGIRIGYRAPRSRDIVVPPACAVLEPGLFEAAELVARALAGSRGEGDLGVAFGRRGEARLPVVDVAWRGEIGPGFWAALDEAANGPLAGARVVLEGVASPASFGDPRPVLRGLDGAPLVLPPGGFGQPSDEGAALLAGVVRGVARPEDRKVLELFAGSGTLSIVLARGASGFSSVEIAADAAACARENLEVRGLEGAVSVGDAERARIPSGADLVVLDPPRSGAPGATSAIVAARPKSVVYVSCDPATLARDAADLARAGYVATSLDVVELFPQTSHVEVVVAFAKGAKKKGGA